jgi:hypothetical protein
MWPCLHPAGDAPPALSKGWVRTLNRLTVFIGRAVTSFVDAEALEEVVKTADAVRAVVGDYAVPCEVYEKWRDTVRIHPDNAGTATSA